MSKSENLHKFLQRTTNGRPRLYGFALPGQSAVYIENHYADDLSLTALSQTFHLPPSYLSSLFKQTEGVGINRYVSSLRLYRH